MNRKEFKTYRLIIKGKVQDVGFRYWFSNLAISLYLNGYIQNQKNINEVEAVVQGDIKNILVIVEKSKTGPELSLVDDVVQSKIISTDTYSRFIVKYDN